MSNVSKNTIKKYVDMCSQSGRVWTETELISFRSLINTKLRHEPDVRDMLVELFYKSLDVAPFQLEMSQQIKGMQWLKSTQLNKKGELREADGVFIASFELDVLREFKSMELVGLRDVAMVHSQFRAYTPIYRVTGFSGAAFEYCMNSYGTFEVTDIRCVA